MPFKKKKKEKERQSWVLLIKSLNFGTKRKKNAINVNGIETLDKIKYITDIIVVILSSQDKIEVAINCMHHKAFDYVIKSETAFMRLQKIITVTFRYKKMEKELN